MIYASISRNGRSIPFSFYSICSLVFFCAGFGVGLRSIDHEYKNSKILNQTPCSSLLQKYIESQSLDFSSVLMHSFHLLLQHILDTLPRHNSRSTNRVFSLQIQSSLRQSKHEFRLIHIFQIFQIFHIFHIFQIFQIQHQNTTLPRPRPH